MSSYLRQIVFLMDDESESLNLLIRILHVLYGNVLSMCYSVVTAVGILVRLSREDVSLGEATANVVTVAGCLTCGCTALFWRRGRAQLCLTFDHFANAAQMLENLSPESRKNVQKDMAFVKKVAGFSMINMWVFAAFVIAGACITGRLQATVWFFEDMPHWFQLLWEIGFHLQTAAINVNGFCAIAVAVLLSPGKLFVRLNHEIRRCSGRRDVLIKLIRIHQELLNGSAIACDLFQNQLLAFGLVWCFGLLIAGFNVVSGCYGVLPVCITQLAVCIIVASCETGDYLVRRSLDTADAIACSGWESASPSFKMDILMMVARCEKPAFLNIRMYGILSRPRLAIIKNMYSMFTVMLSAFESKECGA